MVVQGHEHCLSVTLEEVYLPYALRGNGESGAACWFADMPFMTYHVSPQQKRWRMRPPGQGRGELAVKIEGALRSAASIAAIAAARHPGYGHIGNDEQSVRRFGGSSREPGNGVLEKDATDTEKAAPSRV